MRPDFGSLDAQAGEPAYRQIVRRFKLLVLRGELRDGDEAPSRRTLAVTLGVNPNTVQKAFAELEHEGLIATPPNAKSVVCVNGDKTMTRLRKELLTDQAVALARMAKDAGVSYKQLADILSAAWDADISVPDV